MYVKKTSDREPYQIIFTEKELKEAFRNPVTYEMFKQALISQILGIYQMGGKNDYIKCCMEDEDV